MIHPKFDISKSIISHSLDPSNRSPKKKKNTLLPTTHSIFNFPLIIQDRRSNGSRKKKIALLAIRNWRIPLDRRRRPSSPTRSVSEVLRKSRGTLDLSATTRADSRTRLPQPSPGHSDAFSVFVGGAPASSGLRNAQDVASECGNRIPLATRFVLKAFGERRFSIDSTGSNRNVRQISFLFFFIR